ncbi:rhomboid family intramembrane serine protease [Halobacteriales archaeon SW_7_68_16]|nr:MAG: rhomboid family intramembrane serine protease [Halobacteriales archaeon SW_7_68_16]
MSDESSGPTTSPTVETLGLFVATFALQVLLLSVLGPAALGLFALGPDVVIQPWTLVTSVYAHAGPGHLLSNAIVLMLVGFPLERSTSRVRFHTYFLVTGALAGLAEVFVGGIALGIVAGVGLAVYQLLNTITFGLFGALVGLLNGLTGGLIGSVVAPILGIAGIKQVIGASGAVFALLGYAVSGNRLTGGVLSRLGLGATGQIVVFAVLALVVTILTGSPGVALVGHFAGLFMGLIAGRLGVLDPDEADTGGRIDAR